MFGNGGTVFFGRIPFITVPVIIGILFVETVHISSRYVLARIDAAAIERYFPSPSLPTIPMGSGDGANR